jgi:hypothetical protein
MATILATAARSDNINQGGLPVSMEAYTQLMDQNSYLYLTLTRKLKAPMGVDQSKHEYRERRLIENFATVKTAQAAGVGDFKINEPTRIHVDDAIHFKGTMYLVTAVNTSTGQIDIVRAVDGSTATTVDAQVVGNIINLCGESHAEGEAIPSPYTTISEDKFDYVMQKDRVVGDTDIHQHIRHYDPREKGRFTDLKQAMIEYERERNLLYYVGESSREITTAGGRRRHICSGVFAKLTTNQIDISAGGPGFSEEMLSAIMGKTMYYGQSSQGKMGLFGNKAWNKISSWPKDSLRVDPNWQKWGIRVNRIITGYGDMMIGYDPVLSDKNGLGDRAVVLDTKQSTILFINGMPVRIFRDVTDRSDIHNTYDAISGTFGLQVKWEELGAQIKGIA